MSTIELHTLANAFLAEADRLREPPQQTILQTNGEPYPADPAAEIIRRISADVLDAIGKVYLGQAVQDVAGRS